MNHLILAALTTLQLTNIILVLIFLFLGFKYLETTWSYKISKPHKWEKAVKNGEISNRLKKLERSYRDKVRFYMFWFQIERLKKDHVPGAFAEVGVYKGETARIIHEMDPSRSLHLFDSFEGFDKQDLETETTDARSTIDFSDTNVKLATALIGGNANIVFHKGYFPDTVLHLDVEKYALVHLDADLYKPTLAALHYFYPRLAEGGVIMVHDYNHTWDGVRRALTEFQAAIPEYFTELPDWQGSVLIVKNKIRQNT